MEREKNTINIMVQMYCAEKHKPKFGLCISCMELLNYASQRLDNCQFKSDKPKCSQCSVHCYKPGMRESIKQVMKFSGPRMLGKHPVLAFSHAVDGIRASQKGKSVVQRVGKKQKPDTSPLST